MTNDLVRSETSFSPAPDKGVAMPEAAVKAGLQSYSKAEIEQIRNTDFDRYERENLASQLIAMRREESGQSMPTDPMPVEMSRSLMSDTPEGVRFVMDLDRMGGFNHHIQKLQKQVGAFVRDLGGDREQRVFMERFDRTFEEPIRYAIYSQLTLGPPTFVVPVAPVYVKAFAAGDPGKDLVQEWGSDAPEMIAKIWKRMAGLKEAIGDDAMEVFKDWFNSLEIPHMKRVLQFAAQGF